MKGGRTYSKFFLPIIICLFVGVRLWHLTSSCLWFDEIFSVHAAEHTWNSLLDFVSLDLVHPPLFYILLKLWIAMGGEGLVWLRLFPVFLCVLAIGPFLLLCRQLKVGSSAAAFALAYLAVNGLLIKYSQEVRMYTLFFLLAMVSMWLFVRFLNTGKGNILLIAANILLVYTHYFGWLVLISEIAVVAVFQRIKLRQTAFMTAVTFAALCPWLYAIWNALGRSGPAVGQNIGWIERPGIFEISRLILGLAEPFHFTSTSADPASVYWISVPIVVTIAAEVIWYFLHAFRSTETRTTTGILGILMGLPLIIALAASWLLPYSVWGTRHLIIIFAPMALFTGLAIGDIRNRLLRNSIMGVLGILTIAALVFYVRQPERRFSWCGLETLALQRDAQASTLPMYVFEDLVAYQLWFTTRNSTGTDNRVRKLVGVQGVHEDTAYFLPRGFDGVKAVALDELSDPEFVLFYRGPNFDQGSPPLSDLLARGYSIKDLAPYAADSEKAFRVILARK